MKHIEHRTGMYQCWVHMNWRCQKHPNWAGRGIKVHPRWRKSFINFVEDMGERPEGLTLDRVNNDGHYSPKNCRWATWTVQNRNRRNNLVVTYQGEKRLLIELAEEYGINPVKLIGRISRGWTVEKALTTDPPEQVKVHYRGKEWTLGDLAKESGINVSTLNSRIFLYGWTVQDAVEKPVSEVVVEYRGQSRSLTELADQSGIAYATLWARIFELNWSVENAVERPVQKYTKREHLKESGRSL